MTSKDTMLITRPKLFTFLNLNGYKSTTVTNPYDKDGKHKTAWLFERTEDLEHMVLAWKIREERERAKREADED